MESNEDNSNHLPHGQVSKWWSYRNPALLNSEKGRIWFQHRNLLPSPVLPHCLF